MTVETRRLTIRSRLLSSPVASLLHRGAWGMADQALLSLTNFATVILIARSVSTTRFGEFSLALTFITIEISLAAAAFHLPFTVISARFSGERYRRYVAAILLSQSLFAIALSLPIALLAGLSGVLGWKIAALIAMVIPSMAAWQLQEFIRQVFYAEGRLRAAFLNDLISYGGQFVLFFGAFFAGVLNPVAGLGIVALTSLIATGAGLWHLRGSIDWSLSRSELRAFNAETWDFGRWTLGSAALASASNFAVPFVVAGFSGVAAAGVIRAIVTALAPTRVLSEGTKASFGPSAARVFEREGMAGLRAHVRQMYIIVVPPLGAYCLLAGVFSAPFLSFLYGDRFAHYAWLLPFFALSTFLAFLYTPIEIGLRARRITDVLFRASVWNFLGVWLLGAPLMYFFGLAGMAVLHLTMPPLVGVLLWRRYRRETHTEAGDRTGGLLAVSGDEAQANLR